MTLPPSSEKSGSARGSFLRRSALINSLYISEGFGTFLLDATLAAVLGMGARSDVLYAAWSLPMTIGRGMFQSLTNSFMGYFAEEDNLAQAYNHSVTLIGLLGFSLTFLFALTTRWWYPLTIPGATPEAKNVGISLAVIFSLLIVFLALSETFRAIYYREHSMLMPSASRLIGIILSIVLVLATNHLNNLALVAWSLVLGAGIELLLTWLGLRWLTGVRYRPQLPSRSVLREITSVVGLPLLGQGVRVLAGTVERSLASLLGPGTLTAVAFSSRIVLTLERFVFRGFLITTIETYTSKRHYNLKPQFRLVILIAIPISVIFAVLAYPLVDVAFGRGRFTAQDVQTLSIMLQSYAPAVFLLALTRIPLGLAYAQRKGRILFIYFVLVSVILIGLEAIFIALGMNVILFGVAYTLALLVAYIHIYHHTVTLEIQQGEIEWLWSRNEVIKMIAFGSFCLIVSALTAFALNHIFANFTWSSWFILILGSTICLAIAFLGAWLLKIEETRWLVQQVKARVLA